MADIFLDVAGTTYPSRLSGFIPGVWWGCSCFWFSVLCFVFRRPLSCVPNVASFFFFLHCSLLIVPLVFSNVYLLTSPFFVDTHSPFLEFCLSSFHLFGFCRLCVICYKRPLKVPGFIYLLMHFHLEFQMLNWVSWLRESWRHKFYSRLHRPLI